jgi:hypothetical protein
MWRRTSAGPTTNLARVANETLQVLARDGVVSVTPRDDDLYYAIRF